MRRGPLVVYNADQGIKRAFGNLPGVELLNVDRLNLLKLAPGGHMGRSVCAILSSCPNNYAIKVTIASAVF